MQNFIMFRIGILTFTFYIHSLTYCRNFSIATTFKTNILGFSEMLADIFPKYRPTYRNFSKISVDIFQNAISNAGGDVVAMRT